MQPIQALVTGGAGFIGSNVVRLLVEHGVRVRVLDDLSTGFERNLHGCDVELIRGDVRDAQTTAVAARGAKWIFHLAACVGNVRSIENPQRDAEVNVLGTINVLEAARQGGAECVVYSSSAATFGELITLPIAEDHPQNPDSPYGVSKLAAETYALCYARIHGLRTVCLRYFNVYGVHQRFDAYGNVIPIFAERLWRRDPLLIYGDGEQTRDFVNVRDVAVANYLAATSERARGVYNIGSGSRVTVNALTQLVQEASGIQSIEIRHEAPRKGEVRHCLADGSKAVRELGFRPTTDLGEGLAEYFRWFAADRDTT